MLVPYPQKQQKDGEKCNAIDLDMSWLISKMISALGPKFKTAIKYLLDLVRFSAVPKPWEKFHLPDVYN